jgi:NADP-reducing hydrogenase subunit HndB
MARLNSVEELLRFRDELMEQRRQTASRELTYVNVGMASCGIAAGALEVFRALEEEIRARDLHDIVLTQTGCLGLCRHEPILEVTIGKADKVAYGKVNAAAVKRIVEEHILRGQVVAEFVIDETPFPTL